MTPKQIKNKAEWEEKFDECLWDTAIRNQQFKDRGLVKHFIYALLAQAFEGLEVRDNFEVRKAKPEDTYERGFDCGYDYSDSLWREKKEEIKKELGI